MKTKKKKRNKKVREYINNYKNVILKNKNSIWTPPKEITFKKANIAKTYFTIDIYKSKNKNKFEYDKEFISTKADKIIKCKKVSLILNPFQRLIFDNWFDAYAKMYNVTLRLIKNHYKRKGKTLLNWKSLRTQYLKVYKTDIINRSQLPKFTKKDKKGKVIIIKNTKIKAHILDSAIKLACANYKSALTNYKRGNIRKFRIRYWRKNRKNKILELESNLFVKGSICPSLFGQIKGIYKSNNKKQDFNFDSVKSDSKIHYNADTKEYTLLVPEEIKTTKEKTKNNIISLDPGLRKFMTGISENEVIKVGKQVSKKIKNLHIKKDEIMENANIPNKIKKKNEFKINRKISNYVDELHWKTINYLTNNYSHILIGDMSAKRIISKEGNMSKINKRICQSLSFYKFRQRLEFKCISKGLTYRLIDERYTSMACSKCGNLNEKLGNSEVYKCPNCKQTIDRDINGARGIYIKQFMKE